MAHIWVIDYVYDSICRPLLSRVRVHHHGETRMKTTVLPSESKQALSIGFTWPMQPSCKKTFWLRAVAKNQMWWPVCHPSAPHNLAIVNYMHRSYYQNGERRSRLYISIAMADALRWYSPLSFPFWWLFL